MKKKIILSIVIIIFIAVNSVGIYVGNKLYNESYKLETASVSAVYNIYKYTFDDIKFYSYLKEDISIESKYGYKLNGTYIYNPKPTKNTVILVHGIRDNRWSSLKYVDMYIDKGYNVLIYDSRHHGESGGDTITYGYYEKYDLDAFVNWVWDKNGPGIIGVHGESMGAATALLHSKINEKQHKVAFYIADCGYSDLATIFSKGLKEGYNIKNPLLNKTLIFYGSMVSLFRSGFAYEQVSPIKAIKDVTTPIMFIHGQMDTIVPVSMSKDMYNVKKGPKAIYICSTSAHAGTFVKDKQTYIKKVYEFLDAYVK